MKSRKSTHRPVCMALILFCSLWLVSCNLPIPFRTTTAPVISNTILTQAAATILAQIGATQTQQALSAPTSASPLALPPPTLPQPAAPPPEVSPTPTSPPPSPTASELSVIIPTNTPVPTTVTLGGGFVPTVAITPVYSYLPTTTRIVQMGTHFYVDNVNLAMCYGYYWAVFAIYNNGTNNLESLSLSVRDLSSGRYLYGPITNNAPFMWADNTCEAGYLDTLISGGWLFVGGKLNDPSIKHHTLGASIKLCSKDSLKGACFAKNLEFVVP